MQKKGSGVVTEFSVTRAPKIKTKIGKIRAKEKQSGVRRFFTYVLRTLCILFFLTVLVIAGTNVYVIESEKDKIITAEEAALLNSSQDPTECIEVLGAAIKGGLPSPILAERIDTGIQLYDAGASDILLFSGDNGTNEYNEVQAMMDYTLQEKSPTGILVPKDAIYLDYAGFSTYESMYRLRDVFLVKKAIIVTQRYHLYRALYTADKLGIDVYGVEAAGSESGQIFRDIREILARTKDFFFVLSDASPTYLGEPIELEYPSSQWD